MLYELSKAIEIEAAPVLEIHYSVIKDQYIWIRHSLKNPAAWLQKAR